MIGLQDILIPYEDNKDLERFRYRFVFSFLFLTSILLLFILSEARKLSIDYLLNNNDINSMITLFIPLIIVQSIAFAAWDNRSVNETHFGNVLWKLSLFHLVSFYSVMFIFFLGEIDHRINIEVLFSKEILYLPLFIIIPLALMTILDLLILIALEFIINLFNKKAPKI